jgi:Raf kinase inhibitor-like YbhB/YbcL family protein
MLRAAHLALASCFLVVSGFAGAAGFTLSSPTIKPNAKLESAQVFNGFGCTGKNISPALNWSGAPKGTKSFAVTVYDPDAPTGSGWWHWVVFNLPETTSGLPENAGAVASGLMPENAVQGRTDFGAPGFGGACPPQGSKPHRYIFTVHALKTEKIEVPADASAALVGYMINANQLGKASFTAMYNR